MKRHNDQHNTEEQPAITFHIAKVYIPETHLAKHSVCTFVDALVNKTRIAWYVCANIRCKQQKNSKEPAPLRGITTWASHSTHKVTTREQQLPYPMRALVLKIEGRSCTGCYRCPVVFPHGSEHDHTF